jgi:hypothetical protein
MKTCFYILIFFGLSFLSEIHAQQVSPVTSGKGYRVPVCVYEGDTIPCITLKNMWKKYISLCVSVFFTCLNVCAQSSWMEWEEQIGEKANLSSWEELYENLSELAEHPFNINTVTKEELEQLPFLSDKMVENILYYVYKYGSP